MTLHEDWEKAMDQLRWQGALARWRRVAAEGRLSAIEWWSLEDAMPYWY